MQKLKIVFFLSIFAFAQNLFPISNIEYQKLLKVLLEKTTFNTKTKTLLTLFKQGKKCESPFATLQQAINNVTIDGVYLEMGVFNGRTINFIASLRPNKIVHGFDSFEGLPEDWVREDTNHFQKGTFAVDNLPAVLPNVKLYKGWFNESLPIFKEQFLKNQPIAFLHIDCDIYSSTKTIFDILGDNIVPGTIISFDELYNYPGFENHELKAFIEFLDSKNLSMEFLAYNVNHEQVATKIVNK